MDLMQDIFGIRDSTGHVVHFLEYIRSKSPWN